MAAQACNPRAEETEAGGSLPGRWALKAKERLCFEERVGG